MLDLVTRLRGTLLLPGLLLAAGCGESPTHVEPEPDPPRPGPPEGAEVVWPLANTDEADADSISHPFGPRYIGRYDFHAGIDLPATPGTPVHAVLPGRVVLVSRWDGTSTGPGNAVLVAHSDDRSTSYLHLREIEVEEGDSLELGERLGTVGQTGASTPHLHLGYFVGLPRDTRVRDERHSRNPLELLPHGSAGIDLEERTDSVRLAVPLQRSTVQTIELIGAEESRRLDYLEVVATGATPRDDPVQAGVRIAVDPATDGRFGLILKAYPYPFEVERVVVLDFDGETLLDSASP